MLTVRAEGANPSPVAVSLTLKYPFFNALEEPPISDYSNKVLNFGICAKLLVEISPIHNLLWICKKVTEHTLH